MLALGIVLAFEAAATGGLVWWAGWDSIWHAIVVENARWFALCAAGQIVAYFGYTLALRAVASVDNGVELNLGASLAIVSVGFSPMFCANTAGGFSIDLVTLREAA